MICVINCQHSLRRPSSYRCYCRDLLLIATPSALQCDYTPSHYLHTPHPPVFPLVGYLSRLYIGWIIYAFICLYGGSTVATRQPSWLSHCALLHYTSSQYINIIIFLLYIFIIYTVGSRDTTLHIHNTSIGSLHACQRVYQPLIGRVFSVRQNISQ